MKDLGFNVEVVPLSHCALALGAHEQQLERKETVSIHFVSHTVVGSVDGNWTVPFSLACSVQVAAL